MKAKYSQKQILEAIAYWTELLEEDDVDESQFDPIVKDPDPNWIMGMERGKWCAVNTQTRETRPFTPEEQKRFRSDCQKGVPHKSRK